MMILNAHLYSYMMSLDAILLNLIEQSNFYILHVDIKGEGGPSVAFVNDVKISLSCLVDSGEGGRR